MQFIDVDQLLMQHTDLFDIHGNSSCKYFVCQSLNSQIPSEIYYNFPRVVLCHFEKDNDTYTIQIDYPTTSSIDEQRKYHTFSPHHHHLKNDDEWTIEQVKSLIDSINTQLKNATK